MNEQFSINTQSKLFQKFMQTKINKTQDSSPKENNTSFSVKRKEVLKQNQSYEMNKCERSMTETQPMYVKSNDQIWASQKIVDLNKKSQSEDAGRQFNHKKNNTKLEGGVELNEILRRAIEKVRFSKIQDLITPNNNHEESQDDSLQKIATEKALKKKQQIPPQNRNLVKDQNIIQYLEIQQNVGVQKMSSDRQINQVSEDQPFKESQLFKNQFSGAKEVSLQKIQEQLNTVNIELEQIRQKYQLLINENKKLKFQINTQINRSEEFKKEKQQLINHARQLQILVTNKEKQIKKSSQDANFWKNQFEIIKIEASTNKGRVQILQKKIEILQQENGKLNNDIKQKDQDFLDIKVDLSKANQQNKLAKQYLYQMTIKLYNYQQEIYYLRQSDPNLKKEPPKFRSSQLIPPNSHENDKLNENPTLCVQKNAKRQRKRQFSTERVSGKQQQNKQQIDPKVQTNEKMFSNLGKNTQSTLQTDIARSARIAQIQQELSEINQLKFINGKIRRRRIQLERQLQQLKPLM